MGHAILDSEDIVAYDEEELIPVPTKVAMLSQGGALFDSMNGLDNVA